MGLSFEIKELGQIRMIVLKGRLMDKNQASELMEEVDFLIGNGMVNFIIDLSELEYMNSAGLGVLINIFTIARNSGGEAVISGVSKKINNLLIMTKLNTVFHIAKTVDEATELLHSPQETMGQ